MNFESAARSYSSSNLTDDDSLLPPKHAGKNDIEAQLDQEYQLLQLQHADHSILAMQLCKQRWSLLASIIFNLMLIIAFLSLVWGSHFATRRACSSSMTPSPFERFRTVRVEGPPDFGSKSIIFDQEAEGVILATVTQVRLEYDVRLALNLTLQLAIPSTPY